MRIQFAPEKATAPCSMMEVLGKTLARFMEQDKRVIALDADVSLEDAIGRAFVADHPQQFIDVGIAEANMLGVACGLSQKGKIPFTYTFGAFAGRRVVDQVFLSGAFNGASVKMIGSMPGITAEINGGTHMAFEDSAIMRTIPGMTVVEPSDWVQAQAVLELAKDTPGMFYMRWERKGRRCFYQPGSTFRIGKAVELHGGTDVTLVAIGNLAVEEALEAARLLEGEGISAQVLDMFTLKPLDTQAVWEAAGRTGCMVTVENHSLIGGLGSAVAEALCTMTPVPLEMVGIPDCLGVVGDLASLKRHYGLCGDQIATKAKKAILRRKEGVSAWV